MIPTLSSIRRVIEPRHAGRASPLSCLALLAAGAPAAVSAAAAPATAQVTPQQMVQAFEDNAGGAHPGQRKNHAKGICAAGEFVGAGAGASLSRSALFSGKTIPVVARFSLGGGDPKASDADPNPRGMALEFHLPGGALQHMTMINAPVFAASTPASFHDLLVAAIPDPKTGKPDPAKIHAYFASHPDAAALHDLAGKHAPTASFTQSPYFGIHTFYFIDAQGAKHAVKWSFVPRDGVKEMTPAQIKAAPRDFLHARLIERLHKGPALWDMIVYVGEPGDSIDNPTIAWPESRKHFVAGTLTISEATQQKKGTACEPINFDPLVMADGIAPSSDPVLLFRSPSYAVSFGKRLAGR